MQIHYHTNLEKTNRMCTVRTVLIPQYAFFMVYFYLFPWQWFSVFTNIGLNEVGCVCFSKCLDTMEIIEVDTIYINIFWLFLFLCKDRHFPVIVTFLSLWFQLKSEINHISKIVVFQIIQGKIAEQMFKENNYIVNKVDRAKF